MYLGPRQDCPEGGCPEVVHKLNVRTLTLLGQPAASTSRSILSLPAESTSSTVSILGTYTIPPATATGAGTNNAATSSSSSSSKTPVIVGATIGGIVFLALVAFLAWFFLRRRRGGRRYAASRGTRGTTPMLGTDGDEKPGMRETPDSGSSLRGSGGMFQPFGAGYTQAPMDDEPLSEARDSMEIEEGGTLDAPVPNEEKKALVAPPDDEHPAYHPLPGKHLPAYVPGQPAFNSLPSQRSLAPPSISHVPEQSPKIPGLVFTPIDISLGDAPLVTIPISPKAELAASPVQPKTTSPIPSSKFSTARTATPTSSPPKSPPVNPVPLAKVATKNGPLRNFSMKHISSPTPGYPSPTAGGKVELPASLPPTDLPVVSDAPVKAPLNPTPAFHHIYLPEPLSGVSTSSMDTAYSTIPIGLGDDKPHANSRPSNSRDEQRQIKSSNLRHEHRRSPQTGHEKKSSRQYAREQGSPPQPGQGKKRAPQASREPRSSPPPNQERDFAPPVPSAVSDIHPALRDQVRRERGETLPKQEKRSPPTQQTRSSPRQERQSPPPLRQQRSDVSAMSESYVPLREQPSDPSMLTVSEESEIAPVKSKKNKKWSASERDGMSLLVYKGDAPIRPDEVSPLFSLQGAPRQAAQWSEDSDMSIQPLALQGREGWSAVPLTPMTPLNKTKIQQRADGMF